MINQIVYEGPHEGGKKQVCMIHAETYDKDIVIKGAPGGAQAGWWAPPVWKTILTATDSEGQELVDEVTGQPIVDTFTKGNPILNKQNQLMWLLVRDVQ